MAHIKKLKSNRWQVQIRQIGTKHIYKTFSHYDHALKWSRVIESELDRGLYIDRTESERTSVSQLLQRYQQEVTPLKRSASRELSRLKNLDSYFGSVALAKLSSQMIAAFRDWRIKNGASGSTVIKDLNTLSHVIDTAIREWNFSLPANPVRNVRKPKANRGRDRRINLDEEAILLRACRTHSIMMESAVILAIETAMRLGEIINLEWKNINMSTRIVTLILTKNGEVRRVPLSHRAIIALNNLPRSIEDDRCFWRWIAVDSFESSWQRILKRSGIEDFRFHDLRHEATSRLFEKNFNMMEVATITGHKTLQMLKRYTHLKAESFLERIG